MSTMEHLFMQIFERRDWIAGQLRQQAESYLESIASNLLAAGGRLPPWLWTAAAGSDGWSTGCPQELNRKQMISEILYNFPSATTTSISHDVFPGKPLQKDVNAPQSKGIFTENCVLKSHTAFSIPDGCPGDNEQQDIVMDSCDRIQKSSLEQSDKQVHPGKRRKLNDGLSKQRNAVEYTGRMTRSRTVAMKTPHIKESLDLKSLYEFPAERDDKLSQLKLGTQQRELFKTPSKVAKQIDWMEDRSGQRKTDLICSCPAQSVNTQGDTCNNVYSHIRRGTCSHKELKPSSDAHLASLPVSQVTNAVSLSSSGNNSLGQACLDDLMNSKHEDAPDTAYHAHFKANVIHFTSSSKACPDLQPRQVVTDGMEEWPLHGDFNAALRREKQCITPKIFISGLEPLESLTRESVSQDSKKADNSIFSIRVASDPLVTACNSPSRLDIVDDTRQCISSEVIVSRLEPLESATGKPNFQVSNQADNSLLSFKLTSDPLITTGSTPELNVADSIVSTLPHSSITRTIKARVSNEKLDTCLEMKHQNTSPAYSIIKLGPVLSPNGEKSFSNPNETDHSSMAVELQGKSNNVETTIQGEDEVGRVVQKCQEKGLKSVERTDIRCDTVSCNRRSSHASSLSSIEHLHGNSIAYTSSSEDGTLNCFSEFSGHDDSKQDENGNGLSEIQPPHRMEGKDMESNRAEATDACAGGYETNDILLEAEEMQNGALKVAASECTPPPPSDAIVQNQLLETQNCQKSPTLIQSSRKDSLLDKSETFSVQSPIMGNMFIFDDPNLQQLTRERASALEQLQGSMNIPTPFSCSSTKCRTHRVSDTCQSLPSEYFKCMNLDDHLQSSGRDSNDLGGAKDANIADSHWNMVANFDSCLLGRSVSHSMPSLSNQFSYNVSRAPFTPPVEKFSQSFFLERKGCGLDRIGSYPELTCFRIDENARSLEENMLIDEFQDSPADRFGSREKGFSSVRKALADVSSIYQNATAIGSEAEKKLDQGIFGFVKTEPSFLSKMNDKHNLDNGCLINMRSKVENKENESLSMSGNDVQKVVDMHSLENGCLSNMRSKAENKDSESLSISENKVQKVAVSLHSEQGMVSMKTGEQKRSQAILDKKNSNIVSNISSFIPLVKQKQQAAAPITGKREIKVKALEAAEAAKRLAEKKENERKMRKETSRLERIKLEQENARQLGLKQKQKEEDRKKREANIAAKKRQREEEERKEKQRKRNCTEGAQRWRKDFEERARAEKGLQQKAAEDKEHKRKALAEVGMQHKADKRQIVPEVKLIEVDQDSTDVSIVVQNGSNSLQFYGEHKDMKVSHKAIRSSSELQQTMQEQNIVLKENRQSQSYEISPYRDSDDEDGDDDKKHKKKFIPSWAR